MKSISWIKSKYYKMAKSIDVSKKFTRFAEKPLDFGYPHIEYKKGRYHYIVTERGQEIERKSTVDYEELLYWLISDLTSTMAQEYELKNRDESEDCRRKYFSKDLELLNKINKEWEKKKILEYNLILLANPFNDNKEPQFL